jgi:hypothetical protein
VLGVDGFGAAAFGDEFFLILEGGEEIDDAAGIFFELGRLGVDGRFQDGSGHAMTSEWRCGISIGEEGRIHHRGHREHGENDGKKGQKRQPQRL